MGEYTLIFENFIANWGAIAVAILMAMENACIPVPSELILGFAGFMVFLGKMGFWTAVTAGMIGGMVGSVFAYVVGDKGGRPFVDKYGHYFFIKASHVNLAQNWFDKYGLKAVFFSRMLPVIRTFISLPAGFAHVDFTRFLILTFAGSLPWTILLVFCGMMLGEGWEELLSIGHTASIAFVCVVGLIVGWLIYRHYRGKHRNLK